MTLKEIERRIEKIRGRPLILLCRTADGAERKMTVKECIATGSSFIHVAAGNSLNDLDELLAHELETATIVENREHLEKLEREAGE